MADTNERILVSAIDNASNVLKNIGDNIEKSLGKATQQNVSGLTGALEGAAGGFGKLALLGGEIGVVVGAVSVGIEKVGGALGSLMRAAGDEQRVMALTNSTLANTTSVTGITADQVHKLALSIEQTTPVSLVAAQSAENMLLSYTNIGHTVFPQATKAVIDMATAMNGGLTPGADQLTESSRRLGLALQDPVNGLGMLSRSGVRFTDDEKNVMKAMVDTGKVAEAQGVILDKVMGRFGGDSAAQLQTFQGSMDHLKNSFELMSGQLGSALLPSITSLANSFSGTLSQATDYLAQHMGQIQAVMTQVAGFAKFMAQVFVGAIEVMVQAVVGFGRALQALFTGNWGALADIAGSTFSKIGSTVRDTTDQIVQNIGYTAAKSADEWQNGTERQKNATIAAMDGANQAYSNASAKARKAIEEETATYLKELAKRNEAFQQSLDDMIRSHEDKVIQLKQQMAEENATFDSSMADEKATFKETMDTLVSNHEDKVTSIERSILEEKDTFETALADEKQKFQETMETMSQTHDAKVVNITRQMEREAHFGQTQNDAKYLDLKQSLNDENAAYTLQVTKEQKQEDTKLANMQAADVKKLAQYQTELSKEAKAYQDSVDKANAAETKKTETLQEQHNKQVANVQKQLDIENKLLNAHQAEVAQADKDANDDAITRLEKTHDRENADALANHLQKVKDLASQGTSEIASYGGPITTGMDKLNAGLEDKWKKMGDNLVTSIKKSGNDAGEGLIQSFLDGIGHKIKTWTGSGVGTAVTVGILNTISSGLGSLMKDLNPGGIFKQAGGIVPGPIGMPISIVAHGGEYVTPQGMTPQGQGAGMTGSVVFNVSIGLYAGSETEKRNVAKEMYAALLQLAQSQHKTVQQYMNG